MPAPGDPAQHRLEVGNLLREVLGRDPNAEEIGAWTGVYIPEDVKGTDKMGAIRSGMSAADFQFRVDEMARKNLLDRQKREQDDLYRQYEEKLKGQEKLTDAYRRLEQESGIPELSKQANIFKGEIYKVKDLLDRLDEDVASRTKGTFTTDAQRNRQIAAEATPLQTNLARLGTGLAPISEQLTSAQNRVATLIGLTDKDQVKELQPYIMKIEQVTDRFAREMTGFTQAREQQLNIILDQIQRGREIADRDWQLAQQLAAEKREFQRQKDLAAIQHSYSMKQARASRLDTSELEELLRKANEVSAQSARMSPESGSIMFDKQADNWNKSEGGRIMNNMLGKFFQ